MNFLSSIFQNIPVLKNFYIQEKKLCYSNRTGLECIDSLFQTVEETPQPISTHITGTIPKWIRGNLLRNGPGKFEFGKDSYNHWFDGMALMHKFTIENGCVTYTSKFLESDSYKANQSQNRIVVSEFGTVAMPDPCKSVFQRFLSTFEIPKPTDNGNISFMKYENDYYVSTETNLMYKVDPETLETKEKVDWSKYIAVNGATAHPHYDPDGTAYNMGNSYGKQGIFYNIIKVPAQQNAEETLHGARVVCSIPARNSLKPSYYHSFGMTENYIVFIEQPITINVLKIITGNVTGTPISKCLNWDPSCEVIFHVVKKHSGELHPVTFHAQPFSCYHQINAFEDQGCIVLDICCQEDGDAVKIYNLQNLRKSGHALDEVYNTVPNSLPRRFVFPLNIDCDSPQDVDFNPLSYTTASVMRKADGKVWCTHENLYDSTLEDLGGLEFPAINYLKYNTKKYRYFYGCGLQHFAGTSLLKVDVGTKQVMVWQEDGFYPSEPVFVPCPDANEEDDGVILSVVVSPRQEKKASLLILDAKSFMEMGRAVIPVKLAYGLHGLFVPQKP
ncbi:beta,beta-carotene 9, 10 -oxygenase isoform X1 [Pelobates cultripes]|uniref:Beta,beta-carotene 9,10 -oxygenase isoform X1 n=1 Tax=Pelobates cultripes TaxID=61616 RepID=A0AAD1WP69_PELCU|nr:beta,beta-carotene 9, 10 -oxygenase isoform X1 [Pelobates cultripes]